jgi:Putative auto-transporter adhesin, head GIN domain
MKSILNLALVLFTTLTFSQELVTKEVGDFNKLKVFDLMEVNLIQSDENKVVIKGNHSQDVKVINDNGTLKLRMILDTRFRGEDTHIEVYFKNIGVIDANEGAIIVGNTLIVQNKIELRSQEGGKIKVGLEVEHADIKAVTGGIIEVSGLANHQNIRINTGGIFDGRDFKTKGTTIGVTAAGEANINASEKVDVRITAGGEVNIYGNPPEVNEKRLAGGTITRM